jgi:hypothetical protein
VDDVIYYGVKSQIFRSAKILSQRMQQMGDAAAEAGKHERAASDYLLAALVLQPLRYSDPNGLAAIAALQKRPLSKVVELAPRLGDELKHELLSDAVWVMSNEDMLGRMMRIQRRIAIVEQFRLMEIREVSGQETEVEPISLADLDIYTISSISRSALANEKDSAQIAIELVTILRGDQSV